MPVARHRLFRLAAVVVAASLAAGCGQPPAPAADTLPPNLRTAKVAADGATGRLRWDGTVEAVRSATLSAQTSGRVAAVGVDVNDRVVAGQVLLRLTMVEQQAGADAARAQVRASEASAAEAERQYQRFAALAKERYVSGAQVDQARAARDAAVAARDAARAQLAAAGQAADYTAVRAPYAGIVAAREVEPGETVAPGQPLLQVYAPDALRIELRLPQSAADAIRRTPKATVAFDDGRRVEAAGVIVHPAADPASHSVQVRVLLPVMDTAVTPGTTAKIEFPVRDAALASANAGAGVRIPASALVRRGELIGVYVVDNGGLRLRQLRIGAQSGAGADEQVEVLAGLRAGETIALDPQAALQALIAQRAAKAGAHE